MTTASCFRNSCHLAALVLTLVLGSCRTATAPPPPAGATAPASSSSAAPRHPKTSALSSDAPANSSLPEVQTRAPAVTRTTRGGVRWSGVEFDSRSHQIIVLDQPAGPGTRWPSAKAAGRANAALAVINGGFFTPEGKPLGKTIAQGTAVGGWNSASSLGTAIYHLPTTGLPEIVRRGEISAATLVRSRELLQAGPLLLEASAVVSGLDSAKSSTRSLLAWDGGTRWWLGIAAPCSLADLAAGLAAGGPTKWKPRFAMNLDGGRSSDLWVSGNLVSGGIDTRSFRNKAVRNFLALKKIE